MRILVVGGSSGIGKGLALEHAKRGDEVVLAARTERDLQAAKRECVARGAAACFTVRTDITDMQDCLHLASELGTERVLDVAYIAAAVGGHQAHGTAWAATDETTAAYRKVMETNFFGCLNAIRALLPILDRSSGHLAVINSASGLVGLPGRAAYCASKAALNSVCEALIADDAFSVTLTEIFSVSVSGTNLRAHGVKQGAPSPHAGESAAEAHVDDVVPLIFDAVARKKRRFYIPGRFRVVPVIKHAPLPKVDRILERLVWRKARL